MGQFKGNFIKFQMFYCLKYEINFLQLEEDVVKLTVMIRGIPRRKVYGHALLQLGHLLSPSQMGSTDEPDGSHLLELIIYSSVSEKLVRSYC